MNITIVTGRNKLTAYLTQIQKDINSMVNNVHFSDTDTLASLNEEIKNKLDNIYSDIKIIKNLIELQKELI